MLTFIYQVNKPLSSEYSFQLNNWYHLFQMAGFSEKLYVDNRSTLLQAMFDVLMFTAFFYAYVHLINDVASIWMEDREGIIRAAKVLRPLLFKFCILLLLIRACFVLCRKFVRAWFLRSFRRTFVVYGSNRKWTGDDCPMVY